MNTPLLSNDTIDFFLRHREVSRAKDLAAPPRLEGKGKGKVIPLHTNTNTHTHTYIYIYIYIYIYLCVRKVLKFLCLKFSLQI